MPENPELLISSATRKNWHRLRVENTDMRLASRANKRMSKENIMPLECIRVPSTLDDLRNLLEEVARNGWETASVMYSLCVNLLQKYNLWGLDRVRDAFCDLPNYPLIESLCTRALPMHEPDLLALVYQSLLSEGMRNRMGIYYTPPSIISDMTRDLSSFSGTCVDPCCGSGAFLKALLERGVPAHRLFGCDIDPIAVMLARTNLLIACRPSSLIPRIICADFLRDPLPFPQNFDLIITNPPWGALSEPMKFDDLSFSESFSCFLYAACTRLSKSGSIRFLLPESVLNVRAHRSIRRFLLTQRSIRTIRFFDESFSGVTTRCVSIQVQRTAENDLIHFHGAHIDTHVSSAFYLRDADCTLRPFQKIDTEIIEKIYARSPHTLRNSTWTLGIVTGDNKSKLFDSPAEGLEPIYTGKEIEPYCLKPAKKYIRYDRAAFQQVAPDECYRAETKLVYRFICDRPVFALDQSGSLCLNSANILIPHVSGLSVYSVLALLNSAPIQYLYIKLFGGVKVLKSHLGKLPLPALTKTQDEYVSSQAHAILCAAPARRRTLCGSLDAYFCALFDLSEEEQAHIAQTLH